MSHFASTGRTALSRRTFLKYTAAGAGALALGGCATRGRVIGANGDIRVAVVGLGIKGSDHVNQLSKMKGVRVVALCDCDRARLDREVGEAARRGGARPAAHADYREVLDRADVDAVVIATCNHQHALQAIWACQAGKDVYVEKPVSHNYFEGAQLVRAATKYGRIVQGGTQNRSDEGLIPAFDAIHKGELGAIRMVRGFCYRKRDSIGRVTGPQKVPASVDYNLWCGPAPMDPLTRRNLHYDWHWVWPTGNGDLGNQGVHEVDLIRWVLGDTLPRRVMSLGGRLGYADDATTPNTQLVLLDFEKAPALFEVRGLPMRKGMQAEDHYRGIRVGVVVECEHGYFAGGRGGGAFYDPAGKRTKHFPGDGGGTHMRNFFDVMRSRRTADLRAPVVEGHLSSAAMHFGNISYQVGAPQPAAAWRERLSGRTEALAMMDRLLPHLEANEVDIVRTPLTAGPWLDWDARREVFSGGPEAAAANALLTRAYRAPFVVPEHV